MSDDRPAPRGVVQFVFGVGLLSACLDVRLPAHTEWLDFVRLSPDVIVALALLALFAPEQGTGRSRAFLALSTGVLLLLRAVRIADGVCLRYLDRGFHPSSDLGLVPEFARLGLSTLGGFRFALWLLVGACAFAVLGRILFISLRELGRALARPRTGDLYLGVAACLALIGLAPLPYPALRASLFAEPVTPWLVHELELFLTDRGLYDDPEHKEARQTFDMLWQARQARFRATPHTLAALHGADVHLVLVEAYGHTVLANPAYLAALAPEYRELDAALADAGFSVCTDFVRATVFGGNSWLTHATLESAMPITDQFEYALMLERPSLFSLAQAFRAAGYRAISVKPGTTRAAPHTRIYGFDREYAAVDFGYRGPSYAWAPMPDEYVLEQVAERELRAKRKPLFLEYALVSTHFPFDPLPPYIEDWGSLGDGSVYRRLPPRPIARPPGLDPYAAGYLESMRYELHVLAKFIPREVQGDALVLLLGDHQPIAPVAGADHSRSTPLHAISRRSELLEPFRARGCTPGWFSARPEPHRTMEDFPIDLLRDLSIEAPERPTR